MLRLVGGPSVLTPFERSCPVSYSMTFKRMLRHVHIAMLRAVTTPAVIAFSVVH